jgi:23S rRNA (adenine2503-C2)-methyltransferase
MIDSDKIELFSYGMDEYAGLLACFGQPKFRAKQLAEWVWRRGAASYDDMTNLPAGLREDLKATLPFSRGKVVKRQVSDDGTRKYLVEFSDGVRVETVGIPNGGEPCTGRRTHPDAAVTSAPSSAGGRLTVCLSTQAGCALGCVFCATGRSGLVRDLLPGEIAEQVRLVAEDFNRRVSNVVAMGQGEPFLNYDNTLAGLRIINAGGGLGIGARHITVSTAGIIAGIERLTQEPEQFTLAVSLHSAVQTTRDRLMPGLKGQPLDRLQSVLIDYFEHTGRRPSLEYALIAGVSDSTAELDALTHFAHSIGAHVNLIPLNETPAAEALPAVSPACAARIAIELKDAGIEATVRAKRGTDIAAACGQLAQEDLLSGGRIR